jgi:hypothetical protein
MARSCCIWHYLEDLPKVQSNEMSPGDVCHVCLTDYGQKFDGPNDYPVRLACNHVLGSEVSTLMSFHAD